MTAAGSKEQKNLDFKNVWRSLLCQAHGFSSMLNIFSTIHTIIWSDMQLWVNCLAKWYIMCQVPLFQFKRNTHSHSDNKCFSRVIIVTHTWGKRGTQSLFTNKLQWCCLRLDKISFFQPITMQLLIAKYIQKFTEVKCANTTALSRIYIE
mgnify:CR=1 FL=1